MLLATKLNVPGPRPGFVPRPRLAERLDEGLGRGLVLVCAPAGSGKTALLADWARSGQRPGGLAVAGRGRQRPGPVLASCGGRAGPGVPGDRRAGWPAARPAAPPSFEGLVTALINELAAQPGAGEVALVLDDYHLIDSQPVHASLAFLLEHRPPGLHPVLASRTDPPLALARLRARGQLAELRAAELRFTASEAAALLREAAGADLPDAAVAALADRTEGWAAGLQLAALSLRGQADVAGFVAEFTGSHRYVLDFLAEEVLERQSEQVRAFLLETSVLERLSGPLCDAVTGRTGSQALLEQVERAGLFLVPLDEVRGWWRYHHLFADLLRARLEQEQPGRVAVLHRNAATWCEQHGLADDAIRHAVAAGEMTWAARLIEQYFDAVFFLRGEAATIHRWLSALPDDLVRSRPRLLLAQAQMAVLSGRVEAVEPLLDAAERASAGRSRGAVRAYCGPGPSLLVNVPALIALLRSSSPSSAVTPRPRRRSPRRPWPKLGEDEWLLQLRRPGIPGHGRVAPRPARRGRARLRVQHRRMAGRRPAHFDRIGLLPPRPGPAGPGPPGRGRPDLLAGAGDHRAARPASAAGRWPRVCGPGRGGLPAERARHRSPACYRGRRAMPAVRPHRAAGHRPCDAGVDPAGQR